MAEHERNKLSERTKQGLAVAKRNGVRLGPPPKMTDRKIRNAMQRLMSTGLKDVAKYYHVHPWTLTRAIRRFEEREDTDL